MYGAEFFNTCSGARGDVPSLNNFENLAGGGDVTKEHMWTFDTDYSGE